ncbi:hypothetical protein BpHYR1_020081 [Brachionus plicatilis]|uniref:Uncharacterized protein n=1 Tax=Brachionus plicatilis TaxID=10195 RepID=A0A3M7RER3_BRAPC|nr:hypothetical protein BpHYR1_020081 [Brachionus plicatilis]
MKIAIEKRLISGVTCSTLYISIELNKISIKICLEDYGLFAFVHFLSALKVCLEENPTSLIYYCKFLFNFKKFQKYLDLTKGAYVD